MQSDPIYSFDQKDLKKKMVMRDMTHEKLAQEYGCSKQNISFILARGTAKLSNIRKIEEILHADLVKEPILPNWRERGSRRYTPDKKKILYLLVDRDMKRKELAAKIGINYPYFCRKLNLEKSMSTEEISRMAKILDVPFETLIVEESL